MSVRHIFLGLSFLATVGTSALVWVSPSLWWIGIIVAIPILIGLVDIAQPNQTIRRNFPIIGNLRYLFEAIRPEIMQYFVETDTEGRPINRIFRAMIYQRAKKATDTTAFGTRMDVYRTGYEWMDHSMHALDAAKLNLSPRVTIGGGNCQQPYDMSVLNVSGMSFGSLSAEAIMALNQGAKIGGFSHNTGEGSISSYHLKFGGDLVWQIGTGYFGCRTNDGKFCAESFRDRAAQQSVKMIEIKISQGAKPGHGGMLPASKNTLEIATARQVEPHTAVHSPPAHSAFDNATGLMEYVQQLRELSDGKPVGFKLCVGRRDELEEVCQAMITTGIRPDFITVDGGEGGTGAAPVEFSNSLGRPMRDGLSMMHDMLVGYDLRSDIRILASGKIISGFHMARAFALGADVCVSARAMMMAIGCIQALVCNLNTCPTGIATQKPALAKGLDVNTKAQRLANYHNETVGAFVEMIAAAGLQSPADVQRKHINRRIAQNKVTTYADLYPEIERGSLRA